jgi:hypothetical protein
MRPASAPLSVVQTPRAERPNNAVNVRGNIATILRTEEHARLIMATA